MVNVNELDSGKEFGASCNDILGVWVRDANSWRRKSICQGPAGQAKGRPKARLPPVATTAQVRAVQSKPESRWQGSSYEHLI